VSLPPPTNQQARIIWGAVTGLALAVIGALLVGLIWGLGKLLHLLGPVLWPIAVAGVLAYLLDPVVDLFERKGVPRTRAILVVFFCAVMLMLAMATSVVPQLVVETRDLAQRIPAYAQKLRQRADNWINNPPAPVRRLLEKALGTPVPTNSPSGTNATLTTTNTALTTNAAAAPAVIVGSATNLPPVWAQLFDKSALGSATEWMSKALVAVGSWLFGQVLKVAGIFGVLAGLALIPVYAFYFLLEKRGIESKWTDYLPVKRSEFKDELVFVLRAINGYLIVFFRGQVLVAICDGILYAIGFSIIGLPYSVLLGVMATALTMIPFLGAIATCGTALILAFVQFGDWKHPLAVLGVFAVVQALEGLVIQPKILGDRVGLHPLTIIIAVMVGTTLLGGILGGILAIPLTAAARVLMFRYVWKDPTTMFRKT
jgi:predicted PurR-regulated permease PerM